MLRSVFAKAKPLARSGMKLRWMSSAGAQTVSEEEKKRLIAEYPIQYPWGQKFKIQSNKRTIDVVIPQTHPAKFQHRLVQKADPIPMSVPPIPVTFVGPAGKVSHQLFDEAVKENANLDDVKAGLLAFGNSYDNNKKFQIALMNPLTKVEDKLNLIKGTAAKLGCSSLVIKYLLTLHTDKALSLTKSSEVAKNFATLLSELRKEKFGSIISAEPLTENQYAAISEKMQKLVKSGEKLIISREIDSTLLGGFIIRVENRAQDLSVASQIFRMESHLKGFFSRNQAAADKVLKA